MTFHSAGLLPSGVNSTSGERVTYLEPRTAPPFIAWRYDPGILVELVMDAEHVSLLRSVGDASGEGEGAGTEYVSWETYYGVGALAVLALRANLQKEFEEQARDLKARVESYT